MFNNTFWNLLESEINLGFINVQTHPTLPLFIYNYSQETQFARRWNEVTINCRGLILDKDKNIIAKPLPKFFNLDELEGLNLKIPNESFEVYNKMDGSLIILCFYNNQPIIATRGSFTSTQSQTAREIFEAKYKDLNFKHNYTYCFELISPDNRIVVNYGQEKDLYLLAIFNNLTFEEVNLNEEAPKGLLQTLNFTNNESLDKVLNQFQDKKGTEFEGVVVKFKSGFRVKLKTDDYKSLHKIFTGLSERRIWECLSSNIGLEDIIKVAPDEMYDFIKKVEKKLKSEYKAIEDKAKDLYYDSLNYVTLCYIKIGRASCRERVCQYV